MDTVSDKVAVVTGGGSGIGRAIALELAGRGCHVAVADIEAAAAERVAGEVAARGARALAATVDVAKLESVEALADKAWSHFGQVDLAFNNAGVGGGTALLDSKPEDFAWIMSVNLLGVWHGCYAFGRRFREQGTPAHICNTGSEHSLGIPHLGQGFYTASKHGVLALSDVLRREVPEHIGVSILCPGLVDTAIFDSTRNRPEELGGHVPPRSISKDIMARGMDPAEIGRRAVDGVLRGDFYIITHAHNLTMIEARFAEQLEAIRRQAPWSDEAERYDVERVVADVVAARKAQRPQ